MIEQKGANCRDSNRPTLKFYDQCNITQRDIEISRFLKKIEVDVVKPKTPKNATLPPPPPSP